MKQAILRLKSIAAVAAFVCLIAGTAEITAQAEEEVFYFGESQVAEPALPDGAASDLAQAASSDAELLLSEETPPITGSYTMEAGWSEAETESTSEKTVYRQDGFLDQTETSTITCSYLNTSYSVAEYEQLRDMLTSSLLYSNVNAQISTSAVYTLEKDYLYIVLVDDSSLLYRDIYNYVVGDYCCFCVQVREYRAEAEALSAQELQTPQQVGQKVAEGFSWEVS